MVWEILFGVIDSRSDESVAKGGDDVSTASGDTGDKFVRAKHEEFAANARGEALLL